MDALVVAVSGIVESLIARRRFGAGDWTVRCGPAVNEPRADGRAAPASGPIIPRNNRDRHPVARAVLSSHHPQV